MNAYQKATELGLTGTDDEKVAMLRHLTASNIKVSAVRTWFREQNLWLERSTGAMFGPLQTAYDAASQSAKDALDYLYDTVFAGSASELWTTDPVWAKKTADVVGVVATLLPSVAGLVDSFYSLDGGRPYKDLTVELYQQAKTQYEQAQAEAVVAAQNAEAAQQLLARRGVLESALRRIPDQIPAIVGDSGLPSRSSVLADIGSYLDNYGVTFGG